MSLDLDRTVVLRGAGYSICWIAPLGIVAAIADAADARAIVYVAYFAIVLGFAFGGYAVARMHDERPLQHAAAAAVLAFVAVQAVFGVVRLARGRALSVPGIVLSALLAASLGVLGGLLAQRGAGPGGAMREGR